MLQNIRPNEEASAAETYLGVSSTLVQLRNIILQSVNRLGRSVISWLVSACPLTGIIKVQQ